MDPISIISTAYSTIKFILDWKKQHAEADESLRTLGATITTVQHALMTLDPVKHPQLQVPLQSLVECLNETKNILVANTTNATAFGKIKKLIFPKSVVEKVAKLEETIIKLVTIMNLSVSATTLGVASDIKDVSSPPPPQYAPASPTTAADYFNHEESKAFWRDCFGPHVYSVSWMQLSSALYSRYAGLITSPATLAELEYQLDNLRTGSVSCHKLSEFCGVFPLGRSLMEFTRRGFKSGVWEGHMVTTKINRSDPTSMTVTMAGRVVTGGGRDVVGPFNINGSYDDATQTISWTKAYVGQHCVFYSGRLENGNVIRGTWKIGAGIMDGTFVLQYRAY